MKTVNNVSLATWLAVLLGVSVLTAPPVLAQDTGTAGAAEDEKAVAGPEDQASQQKFAGEITVTAQKREQQLQEVPLSLQVFDGAAMEEVNVRDLSDVFTFIPGASEGLSYSAGQRAFQIRGIAQGAGDPTVGYYMDDSAFFVLAELFAPMGRTFDVQRVEVLRGPQGTLYGNSSMGGTVRYVTNEPNLNNVEAHLRAGYSGTDGGDPGGHLDAAVSVPIVENKLGLRLVGSYQEIGGYHVIPSADAENTNPADITHMRANLLWKPNERLDLTFQYARNESNADGGTLLLSLDPPVANAQPGDFNNRDYSMFSGRLEYHFDFATLSSTTSYIDFSSELLWNLLFPVPGGVIEYTVQGEASTINNETRLVSRNDGTMQWLVGVFYSDAERADTTSSSFPALVPYSVQEFTSESISLFGELSWSLLDGRLIPLVGLRYFEDDRSTTDTNLPVQVEPATFDDTSPRFNLSFLPTENSNYYLNIASGFRSGTFNNPAICELHNSLGGLPCEVAVPSDELWSYEIGTKQTLASGQLGFEAAAYYQDWRDNRQYVPLFGVFQAYQVGDAVVPGIDVGMAYTPRSVRGLTLMANANWNDAHFTSIDPAIAAASGAEEGDRLPLVPEWTAALSASYGWPLTDRWMGLLSVGYSHLEPQLGPFGTAAEGDSRDLLRARFGFDNGHFGLYLFGNNLLGENGAIYLQLPAGGTPAFTQDYPRQIGLEITYNFW